MRFCERQRVNLSVTHMNVCNIVILCLLLAVCPITYCKVSNALLILVLKLTLIKQHPNETYSLNRN